MTNDTASDLRPRSPSIYQRVRHYPYGVHWRQFCERLKWIGYKEGSIERYARKELEIAGWYDDDAFYGDLMPKAVLKMCRTFADEGHSGMSAGIAIGIFKKVSMFEPLTPLTGEDSEWNEPYEIGGARQNKRCSHVFQDSDGDAYDINGRIFREPDGVTFTSRDSHVAVTFPYEPKSEIVDIAE